MSWLHRLVDPAEIAQAKSGFDRLFVSGDVDEGTPIAPGVPCRTLLWLDTPFDLDIRHTRILRRVCRELGEEYIYRARVDGYPMVPFESSEPYRIRVARYNPVVFAREADLPPGVTTVYSVTARWGILISCDFHAMVAGDEVFVSALSRYLPPEEERVAAYLQYDEDFHKPAFARIAAAQLEHLFGRERAREFLLARKSPFWASGLAWLARGEEAR